jgi:2-polyprenyl-6-hydroxyphenyl methylase/3-demethylubiquinone-9 3-methyltransferase
MISQNALISYIKHMGNVNAKELNHFESMATHWWDERGPLKPLHKLNPTRIHYIEKQILQHSGKPSLKDMTILDVGCGGGLVCEALACKGAKVTGIDAGETAIQVATDHAVDNGASVIYKCENVEDHKGTYDVVLALEIIEHVDHIEEFVKAVSAKVNKGGLVIFSTLNRTPKSYALGIVAAEYILRWLPRGTHDWKKFVKPSELARMAQAENLKISDITGLVYNPFLDHFSLSNNDIDVNYFMAAEKAK